MAPHFSLALVADADAHESARISRHLTSQGWQVISVVDGPAALRELSSRAISLAVVRVSLPGMTGLQVVASARTFGWQERVIFVDAVERPEVRQQCEGLEALAYLIDPVSAQALAAALGRAVGRTEESADRLAQEEDVLRDLEPGLQADLCIRTGAAAGSYVATVAEVGPKWLSLLSQSRDGSTFYVGLGTSVFVGFPTRHGWAEFEARVSGSCIRNTLTELTLSRPERVVYRQRRRWPRERAVLPLRAWPTTHPDRAGVMVVGQTEDLGKHGLRACFTAPLPEAELVTLVLDGGTGIKELRLSGRSVWHQPPPEPSATSLHRYGFEFANMTPTLRLAVDELLTRIVSHSDGARAERPEPPTYVPNATNRSSLPD